jgi:hypothetical protein
MYLSAEETPLADDELSFSKGFVPEGCGSDDDDEDVTPLGGEYGEVSPNPNEEK